MASPNLQLPLLLISLSVLSAVSQPETSPPPPPQSIINAAETLASSGYTAMSLTLQLTAPTLLLSSSASATTSLTIFSPPDAAFSYSGQPSLSLLLLHFSPLSLSPASLLSLPFAATIPSLSPSKRLVITSDQPKQISINGVRVSESPIFDDGFVIVYAIDNFFDLNFTLPRADPPNANPKSNFQCLKLETASQFGEASGVLRSRGYSIVASFLDLQLTGYFGRSEDGDVMSWTVFAPVDGDLVQFGSDFPSYSSLFLRHLAPCKVEYGDLEEMANGTVVSNSVNGYSLGITRDEGEERVMVNGVQITFPDLYKSDWLVIHGIRGVIVVPENGEEETLN
ncbi:putative fasciclin-like arabinogalactan protein 20 [Phtheirospermum japonicum]|uniref:Putative fasciclin-like arabinogalactan protein 20 n=1 Tax=Phtheirospermum japonicum TaxID=374723 RepID=A0A830BNC2_9LAMI|nr:putative fasciclin-like arabinogalactan protein 20 [Phtheirospermum japonicum]